LFLLALLIIAVFQGVVISFILFRSPFFRTEPNQYLALAIFVLSWSLLNLVMDLSQAFEAFPVLRVIDVLDSAVLFPVLILLFVMRQVKHPQRSSKRLRWLFVPYLLTVLHSILEETPVSFPNFAENYALEIATNLLGLFLFLGTCIFIPLVLAQTRQVILFSEAPQERKWLTYLWLFEVIFLLSWLLTLLLGIFIEADLPQLMKVIALFTTLLIHWVAYAGVYKLKLANDQKQIRELLVSRSIPTEIQAEASEVPLREKDTQHEPPPLSKENAYFQELERLCSEQKIYRDNSLDRNTVADILGISPSYVSQLINSLTGQNFSTYLNRYRVEEAKILILDEAFAHYSLLSIGLECGFPSKSTYYSWFKKITGMTPNAYRKAHQ